MYKAGSTKPVEDSVSKVNDEIAVGDNLEFQRKWWRFENAAWLVLTLLIVLDLCGFFGRGYMAKAEMQAGNGIMNIGYERIERFGTPSILSVHFGQAAIHDGNVQLWVSENLTKALGNQRVIPQPLRSVVEPGGILYTFAVAKTPATVQFALEPANIGLTDLLLKVPGAAELHPKIFVMP